MVALEEKISRYDDLVPDYVTRFRDDYEILLHNTTEKEADELDNVLSLIPAYLFGGRFITDIFMSDHLGARHGEYVVGTKNLKINPKVLTPNYKTIFRIGGKRYRHMYITIAHELGHAVDYRLGNISHSTRWLFLSEWIFCRDCNSIKGKKHYIEGRPGWPKLESPWFHVENRNCFLNQYAHKSPEEDFAMCVAYFILGGKDGFNRSDCLLRKYYYVSNVFQTIKQRTKMQS